MKKRFRAILGVAVGVIGLAACDAAPPPESAAPPPAEPEPKAAVPVVVPVPETVPLTPEAIAARDALTAVIRGEDPFARARKLGELLPTLGPEAIPGVEETLEDPRLDFGATEIELLLQFWAGHQPAEASEWAMVKSPPAYRVPAALAAITVWAEADPQAVRIASLKWVGYPGDVRDAVRIGLVRGWFARSPSEVVEFIREIDMGFGRQRALATYVRAAIQKQGPEAVMRWAESVPDDDATYKTAVYRQLAAALPLFDQDAGIRWCEAHCEGPFGSNLRDIIARRWVLDDGPAAFAWLATAPEGREKDLAVRSAFGVWGRSDRRAAVAWMSAQPIEEPDTWLRPAFPVYARFLAWDAPAEAIQWAQRIDGDEEREIVLTDVARIWRQIDEEAAEAWLEESPLSEEARAKARAPKQQFPFQAQAPS